MVKTLDFFRYFKISGLFIVLAATLLVTGCASNKSRSLIGNGRNVPLSERQCLERVMYFESNRSSREGMIAVGTVVMNRVNSSAYPDTICGVVGQKNQFAPGVLSKPMTEKASVARVREAADAVLRGERDKKVKSAMFFHTVGYSFPYKNMHYVRVAGGNTFYEKRGRDGQLQQPVNDSQYNVALAYAQDKKMGLPSMSLVMQGPSVEAAAPTMVAQADYTPTPMSKPQDATPIMVGYASSSAGKKDEIAALLLAQEQGQF